MNLWWRRWVLPPSPVQLSIRIIKLYLIYTIQRLESQDLFYIYSLLNLRLKTSFPVLKKQAFPALLTSIIVAVPDFEFKNTIV
jgi:hypothetical protein